MSDLIDGRVAILEAGATRCDGTPPLARQLDHGQFNRFLAALPPHDFSLLAPHVRTLPLERGVMLPDTGEAEV